MTDTGAAGYHDVHLPEDPARAVVWRVITDHVARWIGPSDSVIEIGAGYCTWINAVRAARRVAVDIWPGIASHAAPGVETRILDVAEGLGTLEEGRFHVVLASNVLEHFPPDTVPRVVEGIRALLAPGGRLIVVQPNFRYAYKTYFDDYTHRAVFTHVSLAALLRVHGFDILHVEPRFLPYSMRGARLPIRPWLVRAYLRLPFRPFAGQMLVVARKA